MEQVLSVLYGVSGVAASALYIPQIVKYHRDRNACSSISLLAWGGWIAIAVVTILYALYVVKSYLFAAVAGMNVAAQLTVLFYGLKARMSKNATAQRGDAAGG
jgi:cobalamin biosynthesis protein CobD/CbiB